MSQAGAKSTTYHLGYPEYAANAVPNEAGLEVDGPDLDYGPPGQVIHLGAREPVFFEEDPAEYYYRTKEGSVFAQRIFVDGSRQISGLFPEGTYFGLANIGIHAYSAETVSEVTLIKYRRDGLKSWLADHPDRAGWMIDVLNREATAMNIRSLILGLRPPMERFATFLVMLLQQAEKVRPTLGLDLHLTREEIGDYLGLCMETVSRCVSRLRSQGTIEAQGPHRLLIMDHAALIALANEDILTMA